MVQSVARSTSSASSGRTSSTGRSVWCTKESATLPSQAREKRPLPCVAITIRSAEQRTASVSSTSTTWPDRRLEVTSPSTLSETRATTFFRYSPLHSRDASSHSSYAKDGMGSCTVTKWTGAPVRRLMLRAMGRADSAKRDPSSGTMIWRYMASSTVGSRRDPRYTQSLDRGSCDSVQCPPGPSPRRTSVSTLWSVPGGVATGPWRALAHPRGRP